jgi:hypothetical protein
MPKLIIDEFKEAERIIEKGFTRNINFSELSLLAKYYRNKEYGFVKIEKLIIKLCYEHIPYFDEDTYTDLIHDAINVAKRFKIKENIDYVLVTKSELESIKNAPSNYRKILFAMLVLAKKDKFIDSRVKEGTRKEFGYYCNYKIESVADIVGVRLNHEQLNDFKYWADGQSGLIGATRKGDSFWRICFADDNSDPCIMVDDFNNIISFLPNYCEMCGEEIKEKKRYCDNCKKEKTKKQTNERVRKHRNKM